MTAPRWPVSLLTIALLWIAWASPTAGQLRSAQDLRSLGLDSLPGGTPIYFARDVTAADAAEVQQLMGACVERYRAVIPGIPAVAVAILDSATWIRVTPAPYGVPHHRPELTPAVVIVPARPAAVMASIGLSASEAPRFFRLLALHELGHLLTWAAVGLDPKSISMATMAAAPVPGWYREFAADYFRASCMPADAPWVSSDWLAANRPRYPLLEEGDRLHERQTAEGTPFLGTPEYFSNGAWIQLVIGEAARRHQARMGSGFLPLFREQWKSPSAPLTTDAIVRDFAQSNPDLVPWLRSLGAVR